MKKVTQVQLFNSTVDLNKWLMYNADDIDVVDIKFQVDFDRPRERYFFVTYKYIVNENDN